MRRNKRICAAALLTAACAQPAPGAEHAALRLVCELSGANSRPAREFAQLLCAHASKELAARLDTPVNQTAPEELHAPNAAAGVLWARLNIRVSGVHSASARLSTGTAKQLETGGGRVTPEMSTHMSDAPLNETAAQNLAKALAAGLPDR